VRMSLTLWVSDMKSMLPFRVVAAHIRPANIGCGY